MWIGLLATAWAGVHVVTWGETVEGIAADLGAPERAAEIRERNQIPTGAQPAAGTVLDLPPDLPAGDCQPAYLKAVSGAVQKVVPGDADWTPAAARALLPVGSKVCTKADGFATVRMSIDLGAAAFDDITLMPNTCVTVRGSYATSGRRTSLVTLSRGQVTVGEGAIGPGEVVVQTDAGVVLGRAGGFRVAVEDQPDAPDATRTEAVGAPVVSLAQGQQREVPEGFGSRTVAGEAPGEVVALLPSPRLDRPDPDAVLVRPDFTWGQVDGAIGYHVEFSYTPSFNAVFRVFDASRASWYPTTFNLLLDADAIWWRVIGHDELGFEGLPSETRRLRVPRELRP